MDCYGIKQLTDPCINANGFPIWVIPFILVAVIIISWGLIIYLVEDKKQSSNHNKTKVSE